MNVQSAEERYMKIRNFKNINNTEINIEILSHKLYEDTLNSTNTEIISENINKIINEVFNKVVPEKKGKCSVNKKVAETKELKVAMNAQNKAYKEMKLNNTDENRLNFKNLRINTKKLFKPKVQNTFYKTIFRLQ